VCEVLCGLIAVRMLGRHRDSSLARHGLAWLGVDPADTRYQEIVTKDLSPLNPAGGEPERRARAGPESNRWCAPCLRACWRMVWPGM
jgi:hypothetical protein